MHPLLTRLLGPAFSLTLAAPAPAGDAPCPSEPTGPRPGLSVQLWSVRDAVAADFEGTLARLRDMGFEAVEFAGDYGPWADDPAGLKAALDGLGLAVSGAHVGFDLLDEDDFDATVRFHRALGNELLIVPWDERAFSAEGVDAVIADLNALAEKLAPHGLRIGYHNHAQELATFGETTFWDHIASATRADVVLQLDVGWARIAGRDPVELVRRYPGRTVTTHLKAKIPEGQPGQPLIGQDGAGPDWGALVCALTEVGGTRWLVLEQEDYPEGLSPMEAVQASRQGLAPYLSAGDCAGG